MFAAEFLWVNIPIPLAIHVYIQWLVLFSMEGDRVRSDILVMRDGDPPRNRGKLPR
jgi:hypothetical protein